MTILNPYLLPKVRSEILRQSIGGKLPGGIQTTPMPCAARLAGFLGLPCEFGTTVGCHYGRIGKGTSTKVSDLFLIAGCRLCHDLMDPERDPRGMEIAARYPRAFYERLRDAHHETMARWIAMGVLPLPADAEII